MSNAPFGDGSDGLFLWCEGTGAGSAQSEAALRLIVEAAPLSPVEVVDDLTGIDGVLAQAPSRSLLLLCPSPVAALSAAMARGTPPAAALRDWTALAAGVLGVVRRHRGRALLAAPDQIVAYPESFLSALGGPRPGAVMPDMPGPEAGDGVLETLAREALRRDPQALALAGEMEASAIDPSGRGFRIEETDPDAAFAAYRATRAGLDRARKAEQDHKAAQALLLEQLHHAQQDAETHYAGMLRIEAEMAEKLDRLEKLQGVDIRNELLTAEIATIRTELEKVTAQKAELAEKVATQAESISSKNEKLRTLSAGRRDAEGRLTQAEAEKRQLEQRIRQLNEGFESLQLQIEQLHDIREELEGYYFKVSELEKERDALSARNGSLEDDLARRKAALDELAGQKAALDAELSSRQAELEDHATRLAELQRHLGAIEASKSYRLMAPLRRVRGLFPRKEGPQDG